jgi:hypothetical protein
MRGETRIEFDFPISFSFKGEISETNFVTVRAPGFDSFATHAKMKAHVSQALLSFAKQRDGLASDTSGAKDIAEPEEDEIDPDKDVMTIMAMGLGPDKYPDFADFVQKTLTGRKQLAFLGEDPDIVAIQDAVWMDIAEKGGIDACLRIMSAFTDFFFAPLTSQKPSGAKPSRSSVSGSKGRSKKT